MNSLYLSIYHKEKLTNGDSITKFIDRDIISRQEFIFLRENRKNLAKILSVRISTYDLLKKNNIKPFNFSKNMFVKNDKLGKPYCRFSKKARSYLRSYGLKKLNLSISYEGCYIAVCIAFIIDTVSHCPETKPSFEINLPINSENS